MRTHGRATAVGVVLAMLGMLGFLIFGLLKPAPSVPDSGIVIGKESGTIYVVSGNPKSLTPTFNLASARLLLMSQQQGGSTTVEAPTVVSDDALRDIPHNRRTGIVDGPQLLPTASQRITDDWGVCDNLVINDKLPPAEALAQATRETTVYAGVSDLGAELTTDEAILAKADNGKYYLIYRLESNPNQRNANTVRAEIDTSQNAVAAAFGLQDTQARNISIGLLNAIPQVPILKPPTIPISNAKPVPQLAAAGLTVGSVFEVSNVGAPSDVYVLLPSGIQEISPAVGQLIRAARSGGPTVTVTPDKIGGAHQIQPNDSDALPVSTMPSVKPTILDRSQYPAVCLGWNIVDGEPHTKVTVGTKPPTPAGKTVIDIGKQSPDGLKIDHFYMPSGRAAVVQSATSKETFNLGPISLITDNGLRYGIPDATTAQGLGLADPAPRPAPDAIISLLPTGTSLNKTDAQKSYDDIPVSPNAGSYPSAGAQASGSASAGN